jgi:hypothetical protein
MKKFFPVLSKDKATSSANQEPSETQHPSEGIKIVDYEVRVVLPVATHLI